MKRGISSSSKDSFRQPHPSKKQSTLDFFIKTDKPPKQQSSDQTPTAKIEYSANSKLISQEPSKDKTYSNSSKQTTSAFDPNDPTPYLLLQLAASQQETLAKKYLNINFTYACNQCFEDITNYTMIKMQDDIYCIQCAGNIIHKDYIALKALHDMPLKEFPESKRQYKEPVWSFKDEIHLIQGLQLYGIDSYQLIKDYMKTDHTVDEIKAHCDYFINKFASQQLAQKSQNINPTPIIEINSNSFDNHENPISNKPQVLFEKVSQKKRPARQNLNQRFQNLLKIFAYNSKTEELDYEKQYSLFNYLAAQISNKQLKQSPEIIQIIFQKKKYETLEQQIMEKALKAIIMAQKNDSQNLYHSPSRERSPQSHQKVDKRYKGHKNHTQFIEKTDIQEQQQDQSETFTDPSDDEDQDLCEKFNLSDSERWNLFKCHIFKIYRVQKPDRDHKLQRYVRRRRLVYELDKLEKKGDKQLLKMRNQYCQEHERKKMSVDEFASALDEQVIRKIYNFDEFRKIHSEIDALAKEQQRENQKVQSTEQMSFSHFK